MKIKILFVLMMFTGFVNSHAQEKVTIKNFEINIPEGFDKIKPDSEYNELFSLRYKNELKILITDDIGTPDKTKKRKEMYEAMDLMTSTFELKYSGWFNSYNGYDKGTLKKTKINSFKARTKDFKTNIKGTVYYFEISTINIGNYYFDIIITGKESSRASHKKMIDELLNSIKKNSEN